MGCVDNVAQDCKRLIGYLGMELKAGISRGLAIFEEEKGAEKKEASV